MAVDISSSNNDVNELPSRNVTHLPPIKSYLLGPLMESSTKFVYLAVVC